LDNEPLQRAAVITHCSWREVGGRLAGNSSAARREVALILLSQPKGRFVRKEMLQATGACDGN